MFDSNADTSVELFSNIFNGGSMILEANTSVEVDAGPVPVAVTVGTP